MSEKDERFLDFISLLEQYGPDEGINRTAIEKFGVLRMSSPQPVHAEFYEPFLVMVGQGKKVAYVGEKVYEYGTGHLLTVFLPMPVRTEIVEASVERPFLAAGMVVDLTRVADMAIRIDRYERSNRRGNVNDASGVYSIPLEGSMLDTVVRLFESLSHPRDAAIMGETIIDEIYYRLLIGERGEHVRSMLQQKGEIQQISTAVDYLRNNLDKAVSVGELAEMVYMSRTTFFENFKNVLHISPLQYAKGLKLHRAQALLQEGKTAKEAGYLVGYNSPAQFSREYKRRFGFVPSET